MSQLAELWEMMGGTAGSLMLTYLIVGVNALLWLFPWSHPFCFYFAPQGLLELDVCCLYIALRWTVYLKRRYYSTTEAFTWSLPSNVNTSEGPEGHAIIFLQQENVKINTNPLNASFRKFRKLVGLADLFIFYYFCTSIFPIPLLLFWIFQNSLTLAGHSFPMYWFLFTKCHFLKIRIFAWKIQF